MDVVIQGLLTALSPMSMLMILIGVFVGIVIGIVPGIGAGVGLALLLPLIFNIPPVLGLMLLISLWAADNYGASITSILINVPGGSGSVATCFDGYPMSQQGKAGEAIGVAMGASMVGGILGAIVLMLVAPPLAELAVRIGDAEYFVVGLLGMTLVGGLSSNTPLKGLVSACIGLMASFIGYSSITGFMRYNFGSEYLYDGVDLMVVLIGVFAFAALIEAGQEGGTIAQMGKITGSVGKGFMEAFRRPLSLLRASTIGIIVGIVPGIGHTLSSLLAYEVEKRNSKHPEKFGTGIPEGIIGPESANNAVQPAALIPTLTLGIPGSSTSAIFLGALVIYGISPGLTLFTNSGPLVWALMWGIIIASISYSIVGFLFANQFAKLTIIPIEYLVPVTLVTCFIGGFSNANSYNDLMVVFVFGLMGVAMKIVKYPAVPVILGIVLGPIMEKSWYRSLMLSEGSYDIFFQTPMAKILWAILFLALFGRYLIRFARKLGGKSSAS